MAIPYRVVKKEDDILEEFDATLRKAFLDNGRIAHIQEWWIARGSFRAPRAATIRPRSAGPETLNGQPIIQERAEKIREVMRRMQFAAASPWPQRAARALFPIRLLLFCRRLSRLACLQPSPCLRL